MKPTLLTSHQEFVNAPVEKIWQLLIDKIKHPDKYVPGVKEVVILEEQNHLVHRRMLLSKDGIEKSIEEFITWSEETKTVIFKLVNDRLFDGYVINQILECGDKVLLDYTLNWTLKEGVSLPNLDTENSIREAVLQTKKLAEEE